MNTNLEYQTNKGPPLVTEFNSPACSSQSTGKSNIRIQKISYYIFDYLRNVMSPDPTINKKPDLSPGTELANHSFFTDYNLEYSHYYLWQLFRLAFTGNLKSLNKKEKENITTFYKQLEQLLTCLYSEDKLTKIT